MLQYCTVLADLYYCKFFAYWQRWACLLKKQSSITIYLPTKENKLPIPFPVAANKRKFSDSIFRLQQTNGNCRFPLVPFRYLYIRKRELHIYIHICTYIFIYNAAISNGKWKPRRFSSICLLFAHISNGICRLFIC
jgi:hypothetical protein